MERMNILYQSKPCYDIVFTDSFADLANELSLLSENKRKACIVTDSNVYSLYANQVKEAIEDAFERVIIYQFPAGEENKTLDTVKGIYKTLIEEKFDRKDLLIALGGGVVGDLTGYTAATYLRGIDFVQIPTTLLSQCDSSIGGKTGVDFDGYKNMVGAFYMPKLVYMNLDTLNSLSSRQYFSGFAEVMKAALIKRGAFYTWLIDHMYEICEKDPETVLYMVKEACTIKKLVVEKDPTEKGERALLNFGHTIGHAIEKAKNFELLHGECVALGCVAAAFISWKHNWLTMDEYYEVRDMFVPFYLPISIDGVDKEEILRNTKNDKKVQGNKIKFVLLKKVGKAVIDDTVTDDDIMNALDEIIFDEPF